MQFVVLDACALIAYMRNERGATLVRQQLYDSQKKVLMHVINLYEVYYDALRQQPTMAYLLWDFIKTAGIEIYERMDKKIIEEGAAFKVHFKMSLADSIALGLASKLDATLLTSDRHEFAEIARGKEVKIKFIR